jgi:hypothetical protein
MPDFPPAIAAYFSASPDADIATLQEIFAPGAHVHDESHDYHGVDAIRAWRVDTYAKTPFTAHPLEMADRDGTIVVAVEVAGAFPGSPVMLAHSFTLADGRIASLDIR